VGRRRRGAGLPPPAIANHDSVGVSVNEKRPTWKGSWGGAGERLPHLVIGEAVDEDGKAGLPAQGVALKVV
jgi:hypothetical protein